MNRLNRFQHFSISAFQLKNQRSKVKSQRSKLFLTLRLTPHASRFSFFLLTSYFLLLTFAFATTYPYTVTDDLGNEVTLQEEPMRIVTMIPSHTETVCAFNACDKLVGIDEYSNYPEQVLGLDLVGNSFAPNIEAIVALEPDLVLIDESSELAQSLRDLGLNVYAGTAQTYDETFEKLSTIGALINREIEAAVLIGSIEGRVAAIEALTAKHTPKSVYFEIDATPYSVGPSSFIGVLIAKAGGANIVTEDMGEFPQLDPEFVVAANPEFIFLADAPYGESLGTVFLRAGWDSLDAVQAGNERVFEMTQEEVDMTNRPGPRIGDAIEYLAQKIQGIY